jgi:type IV pilus assembly protein PilW
MLDILTKKEGFTLPELLVVMVISGMVMAAMYSSYYSQQKSYVVQEQVAAMQQNLRVAIYYMEREIRMAGCDPTRAADAGITVANADSISFTEDITGAAGAPDADTSDPNKSITYSLSAGDLWREDVNGIGNQTIAENIDALNFVYLDGASPANVLDDDGNGNVTTSISQIRSVQITALAKAGREDPGYANNITYTNRQGTLIFSVATDGIDNDGDGTTDEADEVDGFRRKPLTITIKCRNLGL